MPLKMKKPKPYGEDLIAKIYYKFKNFFSNIRLFRGYKWIPGKILAYKHVHIVFFFCFVFCFFDKFAMFNQNVHQTANLP